MSQYVPYIFGWIVIAIIGAAIGSAKGNAQGGFWMGLLLGPLGLLITACMKASPAVQAAREAAVEAERAKLRQTGATGQ